MANNIKQLRKSLDLTQAELAQKLNVTTSAVGMYETGARKPSYDVLIKLAKIFNVPIEDIINNTDKSNDITSTNDKKEVKLIQLQPNLFAIEYIHPLKVRAKVKKEFNAPSFEEAQIAQIAIEHLLNNQSFHHPEMSAVAKNALLQDKLFQTLDSDFLSNIIALFYQDFKSATPKTFNFIEEKIKLPAAAPKAMLISASGSGKSQFLRQLVPLLPEDKHTPYHVEYVFKHPSQKPNKFAVSFLPFDEVKQQVAAQIDQAVEATIAGLDPNINIGQILEQIDYSSQAKNKELLRYKYYQYVSDTDHPLKHQLLTEIKIKLNNILLNLEKNPNFTNCTIRRDHNNDWPLGFFCVIKEYSANDEVSAITNTFGSPALAPLVKEMRLELPYGDEKPLVVIDPADAAIENSVDLNLADADVMLVLAGSTDIMKHLSTRVASHKVMMVNGDDIELILRKIHQQHKLNKVDDGLQIKYDYTRLTVIFFNDILPRYMAQQRNVYLNNPPDYLATKALTRRLADGYTYYGDLKPVDDLYKIMLDSLYPFIMGLGCRGDGNVALEMYKEVVFDRLAVLLREWFSSYYIRQRWQGLYLESGIGADFRRRMGIVGLLEEMFAPYEVYVANAPQEHFVDRLVWVV